MASALVAASTELAREVKRRKRNRPLSAQEAALLTLHAEVLRLRTENRRLIAMLATAGAESAPTREPAQSVDAWPWCDECRFSHPDGMHVASPGEGRQRGIR